MWSFVSRRVFLTRNESTATPQVLDITKKLKTEHKKLKQIKIAYDKHTLDRRDETPRQNNNRILSKSNRLGRKTADWEKRIKNNILFILTTCSLACTDTETFYLHLKRLISFHIWVHFARFVFSAILWKACKVLWDRTYYGALDWSNFFIYE